jgi:hypothetical protein
VCCRFKNDFCKTNQELVLFPLKYKPTLVPAKSQELVQNLKYTFEGFCNETRVDMRILGDLLFMWGVVPCFKFCVSIAASQKNPVSALRKWKKHFSWDETKIATVAFLAIPRTTCVSDMASFRQTMPWSEPNLGHLTFHATSNVVGYFCEETFW